jgi:hypothetical protein
MAFEHAEMPAEGDMVASAHELAGEEQDHMLVLKELCDGMSALHDAHPHRADRMWDNRFTQHYVINDFVGERMIERVTVMGDQVQGAKPRWRPWPEVVHGTSSMSRHDRQLVRHLRMPVADAAE